MAYDPPDEAMKNNELPCLASQIEIEYTKVAFSLTYTNTSVFSPNLRHLSWSRLFKQLPCRYVEQLTICSCEYGPGGQSQLSIQLIGAAAKHFCCLLYTHNEPYK